LETTAVACSFGNFILSSYCGSVAKFIKLRLHALR
jgi:hypothetical protein